MLRFDKATYLLLFFNPIQDEPFWGCSRMGVPKRPTFLKYEHTSCNYETWHNYTLSKSNPKNI